MKNRGRKERFIIFIVLILLIGGFAVNRHLRLYNEEAPTENKNEEIQDEGYIFEGTALSVVTPNGDIEWRLDAQKIQILKDNKSARLEEIEAKFQPDTEGRSQLQITAGNAFVNLDTRVIKFTEKVIVDSISEGILQLNEVTWYPDSAKLIGEGDVRYVKETFIITGDIVEADIKDKKVKINGNPVAIEIDKREDFL